MCWNLSARCEVEAISFVLTGSYQKAHTVELEQVSEWMSRITHVTHRKLHGILSFRSPEQSDSAVPAARKFVGIEQSFPFPILTRHAGAKAAARAHFVPAKVRRFPVYRVAR